MRKCLCNIFLPTLLAFIVVTIVHAQVGSLQQSQDTGKPKKKYIRKYEYRITPGEVLSVNSVISTLPGQRFPTKVTVRPDGTITFPYIGTFNASGLTVFELSDNIQGQLLLHFKRAWIEISIFEYNERRRVRVFGEMRHPGVFSINSGQKLLELIPEVGELRESADIKNVKLIREDGSIRKIDLTKLIEYPGSPENYVLKSGDIIHIPSKEDVSESADIRVTMMGQLNSQGVLQLKPEYSRIVDAFGESGGLTETTLKDNVFIIRKKEDGSPETIQIDMNKAIAGDPRQNVQLREGDFIYIPTRAKKMRMIDKANRVLRDITPAITLLYLIQRIDFDDL